MNRKAYTESEYEYICKYYGYKPLSEIADFIGRTTKAVYNVIYRMKESEKLEYYRNLNLHWKEVQVDPSKRKSGIHGIRWSKKDKKWRVLIQRNKKTYYVGAYREIEDARKALEEFKEELEDLQWSSEKCGPTRN